MQSEHVTAPTDKMKDEIASHNNRLMAWYAIDEKTWSDAREVAPGTGIWVYEDVIPKSLQVIERLEDVLEDPTNKYNYEEALVGYGVKMPEYRDCFDFKYKKTDIAGDASESGKS